MFQREIGIVVEDLMIKKMNFSENSSQEYEKAKWRCLVNRELTNETVASH